MMSRTGVPSVRSCPERRSVSPTTWSVRGKGELAELWGCERRAKHQSGWRRGSALRASSRRTRERPMGLGRCGVRHAKTPVGAPSSRGGRTFALTAAPPFRSNTQRSHTCEKALSPSAACAGLVPQRRRRRARADGATLGWRGVPFFSAKQLSIHPIGDMGHAPSTAAADDMFGVRRLPYLAGPVRFDRFALVSNPDPWSGCRSEHGR